MCFKKSGNFLSQNLPHTELLRPGSVKMMRIITVRCCQTGFSANMTCILHIIAGPVTIHPGCCTFGRDEKRRFYADCEKV